MIKYSFIALILSGCTATEVLDRGSDIVIMNPICLALCYSNIAASASNSLVKGTGSTTQSTSQSIKSEVAAQ